MDDRLSLKSAEYKPLINYRGPAPRRSNKLAAVRIALVLSWLLMIGTSFFLIAHKLNELGVL